MTNDSDKQQALETISALMARHNITTKDIENHNSTGPSGKANKTRQTGIIKQLLGYMGGLFIFAGLGLLAGMIWDDLTSLQRVILTLGTGLVAYCMAFLTAGDERYEKAATPLFLIAAVMEPGGLLVFLDEYIPPTGNPEPALVGIFTVMALQMGLAFHALNRGSALFLALAFSQLAFGILMNWAGIDETFIFLVLGLSILLIAYAIQKSPHRDITPFWYFTGSAFLLGAYWDLVEGTILDLSYLALNGFMIFVSIQVSSRTMLFVSVLGLLGYLGYFTTEYFADVTGWPIALIIMGLAMIGVSSFALKAGRNISSPAPSDQ